jgi:hypothetical protein
MLMRRRGIIRVQARPHTPAIRRLRLPDACRCRFEWQQEHRLAGAADRLVDLHAVDLGLAVCEPGPGVVSEVHVGELFLRSAGSASTGLVDLQDRILILCVLTRLRCR